MVPRTRSQDSMEKIRVLVAGILPDTAIYNSIVVNARMRISGKADVV